jgi:SSS family solute:Na+ symporter
MGTALFAYYVVNPSETIPALIASGRSDAIYPYFVASRLPPGIAGLVVAAIFAAAMSSIDACMNSSSTVCIEDFYRRFSRKERPDSHYLSVAQWLTLAWGVLATLMAIAFMAITNAQNVWSKIMSVSTTGVLGLMALAFLPFKVSKWAAVIGFLSSCACLGVLMFLTDVNFLLWPVIGNLAGFSVALLVNAVVGRKEPSPARN